MEWIVMIIAGGTLGVVFYLLLKHSKRLKETLAEKQVLKSQLAELEKKNVAFRLMALRSQMNPHFIFNALSSVQHAIVSQNNDIAYVYLSRFSKLLRMVLEQSEKPTVTLREELKLIQLYLELEKMRFKEKLEFYIKVADDIDPATTEVPSMILQPFIENSLVHGLAAKTGGKQLSLIVYTIGDALCFTIEDNGIGRELSQELKPANHVSRGLDLVKSRLTIEHNSNIEYTDLYKNNTAVGTRVTIKLSRIEKEELV